MEKVAAAMVETNQFIRNIYGQVDAITIANTPPLGNIPSSNHAHQAFPANIASQ